ncbi:MAG: purine-nucleoside phosphorylase [Candidatus Cloacimonetes bacterium]|nr:purine-nucleoside phosphorylase [Candidatus Cloacimonadota bacterium]
MNYQITIKYLHERFANAYLFSNSEYSKDFQPPDKSAVPFIPKYAIILGTGLGGLANEVEKKMSIPYDEIPGFEKSTAPTHEGTLIAGFIKGVPVIVFKGRFHYYEGYPMQLVVYPVRIARLLGVKYLFVTNAAGSLNEDFKPGQLVRLKDHINMMGYNPLIGSNELDKKIIIDGKEVYSFGERFPSMHQVYDNAIADIAHKIAEDNGISLKSGVYCGLTGPSFETRAECLMLNRWGADLVGMSTVPEVIAAVHCGLKVFAVSVVTNLSNIYHSEPHSQSDIKKNADKAAKDLLFLVKSLIAEINTTAE